MAKKTGPVMKEFRAREFAPEQIEAGIRLFNKRVKEAQALATSHATYDGQETENVESNIVSTILEVFGESSKEFDEHRYYKIWRGSHNLLDDPYERQEKFVAGVPQTVTMLKGLIARLEEKRDEMGLSPKANATAALEHQSLHPTIYSAASPTFRDGHYQNAVFEAAKSLVNTVKEKAKRPEKDGAPLMFEVFSRTNPTLAFNALADQSDRDEQEGMMHLFVGCMLAVRNPRGHDSPDDSPGRALEYLGLISLLANKLDETVFREKAKP